MTNNTIKHLLDAAQNVQKNAHAPYSNFYVGAAIESDNGEVFIGCNVENIAYPLGQCAEATAIGAMVSAGQSKIKQVVIASPNKAPCPPCGGCRQKLFEFSTPDTQVHLLTSDGKVTSHSMQSLLPEAFESIG